MDVTNKINKRITNYVDSKETDTYSSFLKEHFKKAQAGQPSIRKVEKFDRSWYLILKSRDIRSKLESDLNSPDSSVQRNALMISLAIIFSIRSCITYRSNNKASGLINLKKENFILGQDNCA